MYLGLAAVGVAGTRRLKPSVTVNAKLRGMPSVEMHLLVNGLVLVVGCGVFLRLVAKEKHRREKYLQLRLEEMVKEIKEGRKRKGVKDNKSDDNQNADEEKVILAEEADTSTVEATGEIAAEAA